MAKELQFCGSQLAGETIYAMVFSANGQVYNTASAAFEDFAEGNIADYDIAMTEEGAGFFTSDMPTVDAGNYSFVIRWQLGASPAITDEDIGSGRIDWDGTSEIISSNIGTGGVSLTALPWGPSWSAYVRAAVRTATDQSNQA